MSATTNHVTGHVCLLVGGPTRSIRAGGKTWQFEDNHRFGPAVLLRDGSIKPSQPGERSPFWKAVSLWAQQGRRLNDDGSCRWDHAPEPIIEVQRGAKFIVGYAEPKRGDTP